MRLAFAGTARAQTIEAGIKIAQIGQICLRQIGDDTLLQFVVLLRQRRAHKRGNRRYIRRLQTFAQNALANHAARAKNQNFHLPSIA
ncbi:MAG: hypothetical protein D8H94_10070 [Cardiobacterium sp.]|nr:MAG: hypothetical protein D8H94_10070 [Cardiobacterium sp.]